MQKYQRVKTISKMGRYGEVYTVKNKVTNEYFVAKDYNRRGLPVAEKECGFLDELAGSDYVVQKVEQLPSSGERLAMTVIFEALPATSLRRFLDAEPERPLQLWQIKSITNQLLRGLADAHSLGIIHRDLRPSKILVSDSDGLKIKISDFRDARKLAGQPVTPTRKMEKVNLFYLSPEQLLGSTSYGAAADLWAVGCILAELANRGRVLFPGMKLVDSKLKLIDQGEQDTETKYLGQLYKIFSIRGKPRIDLLPADVADSLDWKNVPKFRRQNLLHLFPVLGVSGNRLLALLLNYSPLVRPTAHVALSHEFFQEEEVLPAAAQDHH